MAKPSLAIARMARMLSTLYEPHLDLSDGAAVISAGQSDCNLTRSLAAHCLARLCRMEPAEAAAHVTDGFDDLGIDGFAYDRTTKTVYIVQSKWSSSGAKQISEVDATKTMNGLRALLDVDLRGANERLKRFQADCEDAANDNEARFTVVFAATANDSLATNARRYVAKEVDRIGGIYGLVVAEEFGRTRLYESLSAASEPAKICLTVPLEQWAEVGEPIPSYYGRVALSEVLSWKKHGQALFHKNIRGFVADPQLTTSLTKTLKSAPEHFWYFNNGATLLCDKVRKKPIHGDSRKLGIFDLCGVSVVNGAQTIGIIWSFAGDGSRLDPTARLGLRLISLEGAERDFAVHVTRALNTQRNIEPRDFVALDPLQQRIRMDMALENRIYAYKAGETATSDPNNFCTFDEAATALACSLGDVSLATKAKRVVSELWESTSEPPYTLIFPESIDAETVWRAIRIQRAILSRLSAMRDKASGRHQTILSHGNRFITYKIFCLPAIKRFKDPNEKLADLESSAAAGAERIAHLVCEVLTGPWSQETVQYVFKYAGKCRELEQLIAAAEAGKSPPKVKQKALGFT